MRKVLLFLLFASPLLASPPPWWNDTANGTAILVPGATPNNSGPVNQGQLKNVAKKAALYLDLSLLGYGAKGRIRGLVDGFQPSSNDLSPVNLGQLKAVAKPFYTRLHNLGFNTKQSLQSHGASGWAFDYPWNPSTTKETNLVPANIGQLKWVFSFNLSGFGIVDTDGDKLPDAWETTVGLDPNDPDDASDSDVDSDGIPDVWEIQWGMDPENDDENGNGVPDCFEDFDGDGISNEEEAAFALNPYSSDTDGDSMPDDWELANDLMPDNPSDASADPDEDGLANAAEFVENSNPKERLSADPERKIELWCRTFFQAWDDENNVWLPEVVGNWICVKWEGAQSVDVMGPTILANSGLDTGLNASRFHGEYYFKNLTPNSPVRVTWIKFDGVGRDVDKMSTETCELAAGQSSSTYDVPYTNEAGKDRGILKYKVYKEESESGFDDFERYSASGEMPNVLPCPWIMVPVGQGQDSDESNSMTLKVPNDSLNPIDIGTSASFLTIYSPVNGKLPWNQSEVTNIKLKATASGDAYVTLSALGDTNKVNIARAACLPKIVYTVQPYKITGHLFLPANEYAPERWADVTPDVFPAASELQEYLNKVYESQMNIHFTVNDYGDNIGPVNFDTQPRNLAFDYQPEPSTSAEEAAIYNAAQSANRSTNDNNVIYIYFLPTYLKGDAIGTSRIRKKSTFIGRITAYSTQGIADAKENLKNTVAHEIGHLGLGAGGETAIQCLFHPRPKGKLNPNDLRGFPLMRQSDDLKRLMWFQKTKNLGTLLIQDEWIKFRASKPQ